MLLLHSNRIIDLKKSKNEYVSRYKKGFPSTIVIPYGLGKFCDWYDAKYAKKDDKFKILEHCKKPLKQ
jgi:hypothetical protein